MSIGVLSRAFIFAPQYAQATILVADNAEIKAIISLVDKTKKSGKYDEAVKTCQNGLKKYGDSVTLWKCLTLTHIFFNKNEEALKAVKEALKLAPDDPEALLASAWILSDLGSPREAINRLNRALNSLPKSNLTKTQRASLAQKIRISLCYAYSLLNDTFNTVNNAEVAFKMNGHSNIARRNFAVCLLNVSSHVFWRKDQVEWMQWAIQLFSTVDQRDYLQELGNNNYSYYQAYQTGQRLIAEIGRNYKPKHPNTQGYSPLKSYHLVRAAILQHPKSELPEIVSSYWMNFVKYMPDPPNGIKEWDFKDPRLLAVEGWGDCDDMIMLANDIFGSAGITFQNIGYKYATHGEHYICAFKNENGTWDYIDSDGLSRTGAKDIRELMGKVGITPSEKTAYTFTIRDHKPKKISTFSIK